MKIDLSKDEVGVWGYDRDNGAGAAAKAIDALRTSGDVNNDTIQATHMKGTHDAAKAAPEMMGQETAFSQKNGVAVMELVLADMRGCPQTGCRPRPQSPQIVVKHKKTPCTIMEKP